MTPATGNGFLDIAIGTFTMRPYVFAFFGAYLLACVPHVGWRRTMLFTVEGERDDICAVGQTVAAHELCSKLRPYLKRHHMQAGVGHYGVFSGKRWETQIYPILKNVILSSD